MIKLGYEKSDLIHACYAVQWQSLESKLNMYFILCFEARKPHIVTFLTTVQFGTLNSPSDMPFAYSKKIKNILYTEFWLQVEGDEILWMECHAPLDIFAFQQYCWFQPCGIVKVYKKKFITKPTKKQHSFH